MRLLLNLLVTVVCIANSQIMQGFNITASVSLVYDGGYYVIVDTPSATDINSKELMLRGIHSRNISLGEVQLVVTSHGHPDHFEQNSEFRNLALKSIGLKVKDLILADELRWSTVTRIDIHVV